MDNLSTISTFHSFHRVFHRAETILITGLFLHRLFTFSPAALHRGDRGNGGLHFSTSFVTGLKQGGKPCFSASHPPLPPLSTS